MCPKLQQMAVTAVQPVAAQPVAQIAVVQPLGQIGSAPRLYSSAEVDQTSQSGQITGALLVGGFESHMLFDSGASNCFINTERAERSGIRSSPGERSGLVKVAVEDSWLLLAVLEQWMFRLRGSRCQQI
uniref:Uncharacterized protein n=1 Tax=Noccaea caerulescens TaxID=107243 RepID=A0A1J3EP80_NOCCA